MKKYSDDTKLRAKLGRRKLFFGKHKGKTFDQILDEDPLYLDWLAGAEGNDPTKVSIREFVALPVVAKIIDEAVDNKERY